MEEMFTCHVCNILQPLAAFHKNRNTKTGHSYICASCAKMRSNKYYYANKDNVLAKDRIRRAIPENKIKNAQRAKRYSLAHRDEIATYQAKYRDMHHPQLTAYHAEYWEQNAERISLVRAEYYQENAEIIKGRAKAYRIAHLEQHAVSNARRRAAKRNATINTFTAAQWREIKVAYNWRCVYCGKKSQRLTMDHITPLSQGGIHAVENIVPACQSCNSKKQAGPPLTPVQPLLFTVAPSRPGMRDKNAS